MNTQEKSVVKGIIGGLIGSREAGKSVCKLLYIYNYK